VIESKNALVQYFECDDIGYAEEYVGCRITIRDKEAKFLQSVLLRSLVDEFGAEDKGLKTPAPAGQTLQFAEGNTVLNVVDMRRYQAGVRKLLYLSRRSRPDISNSVRELSRFASQAQESHVNAMKRLMDYCWGTRNRGLVIKPSGKWTGKVDGTKFIIKGVSDSDYAKDLDTRRSVSGYSVFLNGAPIAMKSKMQDVVTLSVTEAELIAATHCIQVMVYVKKVIESIGLEVELSMIIEVDNKGAKDLMNNWSVGGRTRHIDIRYFYIRELKQRNTVKIEWISSEQNCSDLFTKNLGNELFEKHSNVYCGESE
jgi:hypothetical protein